MDVSTPVLDVPATKTVEITIPKALYDRIDGNHNLAVMTWVIASRSRPNELAPISHERFSKYIKAGRVAKCKETLEKWDIIKSDHWYICGEKSMGYCLTENAERSGVAPFALTTKPMRKRFQPDKTGQVGFTQPVLKSLWNSFDQVKIDEAAARTKINGMEKRLHCYLDASVEAMTKLPRRMSRCKYGRIHSNITNLKRELRPCLHFGDGNALGEVDISCSQPTLFAGTFPKELRSNADYKKYLELCTTGKWYFHLMDGIGYRGSKREFKEEHLFQFWYGPNRGTWSKLSKLVKAEFPTVYAEIQNRKKDEHANFARDLQKLESHLVIDTACARLFETYPDIQLLTVHDSIMAKPEWLDVIEDELSRAVFEELEIWPTLEKKTHD